jgi:diketogulonate reductase-like aldo/keto reductase
MLYGTAWKEAETRRLTELAISSGFRGIDTANQRRHYHEQGVGEALATALRQGVVTRDDLFLQTKYTSRRGQDHRLPYDPSAPIRTQVEQSFASSLEHLGVERIDSYVLHGPTSSVGLSTDDWEAWRAMEALHHGGRVRFLGVSNVTLEQLQALCDKATVLPRFVQNRCYASTRWDGDIRDFCAQTGLIYQGFSLLTANRPVLASPLLADLAKQHERTLAQIVIRFAIDVGMLPLTGTTDPRHMRQDLDVFGFTLDRAEVEAIEGIAT